MGKTKLGETRRKVQLKASVQPKEALGGGGMVGKVSPGEPAGLYPRLFD